MADTRYAFYYYHHRMWLRCLDCKTEIFGKDDFSGGVNLGMITTAVENHEFIWHNPSDD